MNFKKLLQNEEGFTLTELLVVIVIIGILAALTIPKFMNVTTSAKMTEAKLLLKQVYNLQKAYYMENDVYAQDLQYIGFEQDKTKTEGGNARYIISIESATDAEFKVNATSIIDYDKDGVFNVWSINQDGRLLQEIAD
ncbi:MAG: prepilin-type N-terminal cleavage/methylation domain-containing protein [Deferribacteres bacterium]|nr:prepilin-type N-terminal cleavage/methylation domain-containing protein [candidate division KSB1 bacterium]MCB9503115.1 prepilin-type N-terminal cleavage/methylation domain-containing protein [Deferribacteres bacterium]